MAKALIIIIILLVSLLFTSGCKSTGNEKIENLFDPGNLAYIEIAYPPVEPPFDPTPEPMNKSIEDFFS